MREVLFHLGNSFLQIQRHETPIREFGSAVVKATVSTVIQVWFAYMPPEAFFETIENTFVFNCLSIIQWRKTFLNVFTCLSTQKEMAVSLSTKVVCID